MVRVIVALSGGLDSCTALAHFCRQHGGDNVLCVGFRYGSKHGEFETRAARMIAQHYHVVFTTVDVSGVMAGFRSSLLQDGPPIPEGHYNDETMRQTVVPGRNLIFISILSGLAESMGYDVVGLGVHQGDHFIYPDCRPAFLQAAAEAVRVSSEHRVTVEAPFLTMDKASIVCRGFELGAPYHLTRTCYKAQLLACGKCGSCRERLEAFALNGVQDPIEYERTSS